jgi:hypothetical protein
MKTHFHRLTVTVLLAACVMSGVGCYPAYPPAGNGTAYQDSKGYSVPQEPAPPQGPRYAGVDPAVVIAGAAAAGLLGYAIGNNRGHHHHYYGPRYYRPVPYGRYYYGPRHYR